MNDDRVRRSSDDFYELHHVDDAVLFSTKFSRLSPKLKDTFYDLVSGERDIVAELNPDEIAEIEGTLGGFIGTLDDAIEEFWRISA